MLEASQPWSLFGYDIRTVPHYFLAGWREFLWGHDSPVLPLFDEAVKVHQETGEAGYFKAGKPLGASVAPGAVQAEAILLPERLVLSRTLRIPLAAEAEIESVVALEVRANSPFPEADTSYGWLIAQREDSGLVLQLVITSQSAVMEFIGSSLDCHDIRTYEIWAQAGSRMVLVTGFGEGKRRQRNQRRLRRMAYILAYCLLALVMLFAVGAGAKYLELQKVRAIQAEAEQSAHAAVEMRTRLGTSKGLIATVNELLQAYPPPHDELKRLAAILGDETWLVMAEIKGAQIKIDGESSDAAAVMQQLLDHPAYERVVAPVAIKKVRSGFEHFVLKLTLATEGDNE